MERSRKDVIEELRKIALMLASHYEKNVRIEIDVNLSVDSAKIKITEINI